MTNDSQEKVKAIRVQQFFKFGSKRLKMKLIAGAEGLQKEITNYRVQITGLALSNYIECVSRQCVQILGTTEMCYLAGLKPAERDSMLDNLLACDLACFVITDGQEAPDYLCTAADNHRTPIFISGLESIQAIDLITHFLDTQLAPTTSIHGTMLDTFGLGVMLIGDSGIGKSECALELVARGHRLVADDIVEIKLVENEVLIGSCPENIRYLMELRGIGLIDIKDLFGVGSVRESKKIELVINLQRWRDNAAYPRLGIKDRQEAFLGINIPCIIMPVAPGRNLSILVEVAARNQLLKSKGINVARRVSRRLDRKLKQAAKKPAVRKIIKEGAGMFE